ncbi:hypothetical protein ACFVR6_03875 [Microbacterium sp. NPDC058021]|uniref:hypothetical protein n=1 Tax=Microbacterium sp. NPDC058021 TaxID=3346306 RepID=UPI0036DA67BF
MTARVLAVLGLLLLGFDCADFEVTGVAVLGAVFLAAAAYLFGVFTHEFWFEDDPNMTPAGGNPRAAASPSAAAPPAGSHDH